MRGHVAKTPAYPWFPHLAWPARAGSTSFGLPTLCDERLGQNEVINFNAGDHSISVSMGYADYIRVENPELGNYAQ